MNCLHKDPQIRPASVREVAYTIAPEAMAQPLFITPPPTTLRTERASTVALPKVRFSIEFYIVMVVLGMLLLVALSTLWMVLRR